MRGIYFGQTIEPLAEIHMAVDDLYPTCYGLEPVTCPILGEPKPEPKPKAKPEPEPEPETQGPGVLTQVEDVLILAEEALEPKTWIRRAAFGLMRLIRKKLR